jgi:hypothetical protein
MEGQAVTEYIAPPIVDYVGIKVVEAAALQDLDRLLLELKAGMDAGVEPVHILMGVTRFAAKLVVQLPNWQDQVSEALTALAIEDVFWEPPPEEEAEAE